MNTQSTRRLLLASTALVGFASVAMASAAEAQTAPAAAQEVVVTGSRIARKDYVADSPIVTVGQKALEVTGSVTVESLLNQLPQIVPNATLTSNNPSAGGRANIALRGIGPQRTLVLVDGRRTTPSDSTGVIDINTIPAALIDNIEVITGGASAAYGSEAIAGVVNFKLKHHFTGVQVDAQYGKTDRDDGTQETYSITAGGNFADDKGNAVLSLTYANRGQIYNAARPFSAYSGGSGTIPQGSVATTYTQAAIDAVFAKYGIAPGTVKSTSKISFNSDGTLIGFPTSSGGSAINYKGPTTIDYSTLLTGTSGVAVGLYNTGALNDLVLPLQRYTGYARAEYEVNSHAKVYTQLMFTDYSASEELAPSPGSGSPVGVPSAFGLQLGGTGFLVPVTNPFIPADFKTLLASRASPNAPFLLAKRFSDVGPRHEDDHYSVYNFVTGVTGDLGFKDWTYDLYASYGRESLVTTQTGNISHFAVRQLLEAADGGASLCSGGYNPFGTAPISAACKAYISRTTKNSTSIEDRVVEGTAQGGLFSLPAGEIKAAIGTDYHRTSYTFVPDSVLSTPDRGTDSAGNVIYAPGVVGFNSANPLNGSVDSYELFGELFVPILKDLPFIQSLNANLGYRFSDYSTAGGVNSYKVDGEWKPLDWVLVRGGFQHAVRAPSVGELFAPQNNNFPTIGSAAATSTAGDPCDINSAFRKGNLGYDATKVRALCLAQGIPAALIDAYTYGNPQVQTLTGGNTQLKAETANTYSLGVVFTPHLDMPLFKRMSLSIDYYNIQVKHYIGTVSTVTAIDKCFNVQGANPTYSSTNPYCGFFVRDPSTGQVLTGNSLNQNLGQIKTSGEDIQFDWNFGLGAVGLQDRYGRLDLNVVVTHLESYKYNDVAGSPFNEYAGSIGGFGGALPEWKGLTTLTYSIGPVDLSARWQYIDAMKDGVLVTSPTATAISPPAVSYFDLLARYRVNDTWEIRGGVNNVGDKLPPFFTSVVQANTDPSAYDVYGRRYYVAVKARF